MTTTEVQLFPLRTVLFPGGPLPLRVFEARYLDMISRCMKDGLQFGVVLIVDGPEIGGVTAKHTCEIGTLARIVDWYQGTDGLLGITAAGTDRFRIHRAEQQADGLNIAEIETLPAEVALNLPTEYAGWPVLLRAVIEDLGKLYATVEKHYDDASWVGFRFAEILPLDNESRQHCLETFDPLERLKFLRPLLQQIREGKTQ